VKFTSKAQANRSRVPHWVCQNCNVAFTRKKPGLKCTACKEQTQYTYFPSKKEFSRYIELMLMERGCFIDRDSIVLQPAYVIDTGKKKRIASFDFRYTIRGVEVIEDVKSLSTNTDLSKIKRELAESQHGITVVLV
jgi:hypothetical protein